MTLTMQQQFDLTRYNTLGLRSVAEQFARIESLEQIPELIDYANAKRQPLLWLGGGSNLVLGEQVPGIVAQLAINGIEVLEQYTESVRVRVYAAENWHSFVRWSLQQGYFGLENLALIPGSVGASPVQNIGAYGVEVCERILSVNAYDTDQQRWVQLDRAECHFAYRDSCFKRQPGRYAIASVEFSLEKQFVPRLSYAPLAKEFERRGELSALEVFDTVCAIRRSKLPDPSVLGNAGSFFKNPVVTPERFAKLVADYPLMPSYPAESGRKLAAGWLIDQAGLKGYRQGAVGVHKLQALVLVNYGGATRSEIEQLAAYVCQQVLLKFSVTLEQEPVAYP